MVVFGINNNELEAMNTIENAYKYPSSSQINSGFLSNEFLSDEQKESVKQLNRFKIGDTNLEDLVKTFESYSKRENLFKNSTNAINKSLDAI